MSWTSPSRDGGGRGNIRLVEEMRSTKAHVRKTKAVFKETVVK